MNQISVNMVGNYIKWNINKYIYIQLMHVINMYG